MPTLTTLIISSNELILVFNMFFFLISWFNPVPIKKNKKLCAYLHNKNQNTSDTGGSFKFLKETKK